jgi:hypothetical protein
MSIVTSADNDPQLAAALGRFSQVCNQLERQMEFILTRLLPLTTDMGRVLFSGNQMRRNIEILGALCLLEAVPLPEATRAKLQQLVPRLRTINDDRSRFLHNPITGGMFGQPLHLVLHKADGMSSAAMPISIQLILERVEEAHLLWKELYIAPVHYDLSKWTMALPSYPVKDYPKAQQPTAPRPKAKAKGSKEIGRGKNQSQILT